MPSLQGSTPELGFIPWTDKGVPPLPSILVLALDRSHYLPNTKTGVKNHNHRWIFGPY